MVSDHERRELYDALEGRLGQGPATTMMELLPPVGWADLARQSDLAALRGEMAQIRGEMGEIRGEMGEIRGEIAKLSARIDGQIPRYIWANVPIVASVAGLVLAAAKLT
ncbi:MAG: hypothetical protein ACR2HM_03770 [Acidimicrobiales bacterium]